jgi:hypothetical protein
MRTNTITLRNEQIEFSQFRNKFEKSDIDLTRSEVLNILEETKSKNPSLVPAILNMVKNRYHISLLF